MAEPVKAWQCIGCGTIDAPQTCIGVCDYRKVEFVYRYEHQAEVEQLEARIKALERLARQLATITPRNGEWERSYRALQARARLLIATADADAAGTPV